VHLTGRSRGAHILLLHSALFAVVRVGDAHAAADHAAPRIRAIVALVAYAYQRRGAHIRVADYALAIACSRRPTVRSETQDARCDKTVAKAVTDEQAS